ncbi:MAG: biopolymer transporter ExbD [Raineya sp.]
MGKVKIPRKNPSLDMTAMCDMAFLLLTFFILTAQFKPETPLEVDAPSSSSNEEETQRVLKIIVDTTGRVFLEIKDHTKREEVLRNVAKHFGLAGELGKEEYDEFVGRQTFGASIQDLTKILKAKATSNEAYQKIGINPKKLSIPVDTVPKNNQLSWWILYTREAYFAEDRERKEKMGKDTLDIISRPTAEGLTPEQRKLWEEERKRQFKVVIFGDRNARFGMMKQILETLRNRKINRIHLVTNLREAPAAEGSAENKK